MLEGMVPDVIISDVVMPVMDGYEFCRTVKNDERFRDIPLILLTMLTDSKDVIYAMVSGADNFITKPYQGDYLVTRLRKIHAQKIAGRKEHSGDAGSDVTLSGKNFTVPHNRQQIIGNVSTIRKLHEKKEALRSVHLNEVIQSEIHRFSSSQILYSGTTIRVMADTLLSQVFTNLLGNSVKFAGSGAEIAVTVVDKRDHVEVIITDNGPGIPDDMKPVAFDRFRKGKSAKSGKGMGLFIARTLVESYGGTIWANDRVSGHPDQGTAIHFTLKKAR